MNKAFPMRSVGGGEDVSAGGVARLGERVMHVGGRMQAEPAVMMFRIVPAKEIHALRASVVERAETRGEIRAIRERLELRFRVRVVVRDGGARMRRGHAEVGEQMRDGVRDRRRSAIRMERQLVGADVFAGTTGGDQPLREQHRFARRDHPAHDVATEHIEDHVQVIPRPGG